MSSTFVTLPGNTLHALKEIAFNTNRSNLSDSLRDKKVEVRWLESEAEMYIKQWRKRYRQLEGIDDKCNSVSWTKGQLLERCEDWCLTARAILDIDVSYMNSKEYNKFCLTNYNKQFDIIFNNRGSKFMFDSFEDDYELENDDFHSFNTITIDPNLIDPQLIAALKASNLIFTNGKQQKNIEKEKSVAEKPAKKSQKSSPKDSSPVTSVNDKMNALPSSGKNPNNNKNQRNKNLKTARIRTSNRRQMYVCEYPGCSYQSDRNFNFLRHKRTHGKQKNEDKRISNNNNHNNNNNNILINNNNNNNHSQLPMLGASLTPGTSSNDLFSPKKNKIRTGKCSYEAPIQQNGSINNFIDSSSASVLSSELNMDTTTKLKDSLPPTAVLQPPTAVLQPSTSVLQPPLPPLPSSSINLTDSDHSYLLADSYLSHQNLMIKDLHNLDHILVENHFSTLTLDQSFIS